LWFNATTGVNEELKYNLVKQLNSSGLTADPIISRLDSTLSKLHLTVSLMDIKNETE